MIERYTREIMGKIWTDQNRFQKMLDVEIAACVAFSEMGIIPKEAVKVIKEKAAFDVKRILEIEAKTHHDVVAFIKNVSENVGEDAKYFHFGLTSSDVLDTGLSIMMVEAMNILIDEAKKLKEIFRTKAIQYKKTPMIGRSHGVHAEPISFGLKMALFYKEVERGIKRLESAKEIISVGKLSGSVGTFANVAPEIEVAVCKTLGLKPAGVSNQVIQRDRHAEYLNAIALFGDTLEKFALEVRGLQKTEIGEVQEAFSKGQTGSSSMPHKKNPIICERITGLARLLRGNAMVAIENVALWHERDISHSSVERVIIPDSTIILDYMLDKTIKLVENLVVNEKKMLENIGETKGLIFSQRMMLELIKKGVTRMEAYDIVQEISLNSYEEGISFSKESMKNKKILKYMAEKEIEECFNLEYHMKQIDKVFKNIGLEK